jgi:hypothetical protein
MRHDDDNDPDLLFSSAAFSAYYQGMTSPVGDSR